jgi:hypothetical protein
MTFTVQRLEAERTRRSRLPRWIELKPDVILWPIAGGDALVIRIV